MSAIQEAFEAGYAETRARPLCPRERVLHHFERMRALSQMLIYRQPKYHWDGYWLTYDEMNTALEAEAKQLLKAKELLRRQQRSSMLRAASRAVQKKRLGRGLTDAERHALKKAQEEGKHLEPDSEDEGAYSAPKIDSPRALDTQVPASTS